MLVVHRARSQIRSRPQWVGIAKKTMWGISCRLVPCTVCFRVWLQLVATRVKHTGVALCSEHQQGECCLVTCRRVSRGRPGMEGTAGCRREGESRGGCFKPVAVASVTSARITACDVHHEGPSGSTTSLEETQHWGRSSTAAMQEANGSYLPA